MLVAKLAGQTLNPMRHRALEPRAFFYLRCLGSLAILGFSFAVTLAGLFEGKTTMWEGVPEWAAVIVLMSVVGLLEGMQIAFFAVAKIPASERRLCFQEDLRAPFQGRAQPSWLHDWTSALCRILHVLHCSRDL
jgi:hypothetical protein